MVAVFAFHVQDCWGFKAFYIKKDYKGSNMSIVIGHILIY